MCHCYVEVKHSALQLPYAFRTSSMSAIGMMDGAFFVSRSELITWANDYFQLKLSKVEQCSNGAVYCQVIDCCHPGTVAMKKVNWAAKAEHESIPNFKVLQQAFEKNGIKRHIEVDKLVRGKYQDNLEMMQWIKSYFDRNYPGGEYDGASRRFSDKSPLPDWARGVEGAMPPPPRDQQAIPRAADRGGAPTGNTAAQSKAQGAAAPRKEPARARPASGAGARPGTSSGVSAAEHEFMKEEHEKLREEVVDLKITVDGLETERDFYFQKLRDIEILSQALEANPDPNMTVTKFVEDVQRILYAKDEEEDGREDEG